MPDIVYLDPPYNQHPYGSNYHVLNTVTLADQPPVNARVHVAGKAVNKAAIRTDWRTQRRSPFNSTRTAVGALADLVTAIESHWIIMSYSTDGNIPVRDVLATLAQRGKLRVFTHKYKRYRVSTPRMSAKPHNIELLAVVDTSRRGVMGEVDGIAQAIERQERRVRIAG